MKKNLLNQIIGGTLMLLCLAFVFNNSEASDGKRIAKFRLPENVTSADYLPQTLILKLRPEFRMAFNGPTVANAQLQGIMTDLKASAPQPLFPHNSAPESAFNASGEPLVDLTLIHRIKYESNTDIVTAINELLVSGMFEYVEPEYIYHLAYTPNDPGYTNAGQYFLKITETDRAWDLTKGDTNVVIGIVDTGTDLNHPDLEPNLKYNYNDPINGADDDADGYVDNFYGWDVADNDNTPQATTGGPHGSHVSGCATAVTDNGIGVAGPGFLCKFLPVKIGPDANPNSLVNPFAGIAYAADHGCQIINCSWSGPYSSYGLNVVDYATNNKNALVVCAAGNNSNETVLYPAGYSNAMAVASTNNADGKSGFSNYGTWVDISSPGSGIYSTVVDDSYTSMSGTSMASPVAAGIAALVKSVYPSYTVSQLRTHLNATADNIYGLSANAAYQGKLGSGRINAYKAVTATGGIAVGMINIKTTDNNDDAFVIGDTLRISGDIKNYLAPVNNLSVTMTSTSPDVTILNDLVNVGTLGLNGLYNNASIPFTAKINPSALANTKVTFKFTFTDGGSYTSSITYDVVVNVDYLNITVNEVQTSVTSKALVGFNDADLSTRAVGLGVTYKNNKILFECGLMVGDNSRVSDNVRSGGASTVNNDLQSTSLVRRIMPSPVGADFESTGEVSDNASASPMFISVKHRALAWSTPIYAKFVILEYIIHNTGGAALNNVYAGLYADWDISLNGTTDKASVDKTLRMGYAYNTSPGGVYAGFKLLTKEGFNNYSIDNGATDGSIAVYTSYSTAEKYTSMSTPRDNAGGAGTGGDISHAVATGPLSIAAGDSVVVAFALLVGDNLLELQDGGIKAQLKYDSLLTVQVPTLTQNKFELAVSPNPVTHYAAFRFNLEKAGDTEITLYDISGRKISTLLTDKLVAGKHEYRFDLASLNAGVYFYKLQSGNEAATGRIIVIM